MWLENADPAMGDARHDIVVEAPRIGIESHGEWAKKPLRFYLQGNTCVSVLDKAAERLCNHT